MNDEYTEAKRKFQSLRERLRSGVALRYPISKKNAELVRNVVRERHPQEKSAALKLSMKHNTKQREADSSLGPVHLNPKGKQGSQARASGSRSKPKDARTTRRPARRPGAPKKQSSSH